MVPALTHPHHDGYVMRSNVTRFMENDRDRSAQQRRNVSLINGAIRFGVECCRTRLAEDPPDTFREPYAHGVPAIGRAQYAVRLQSPAQSSGDFDVGFPYGVPTFLAVRCAPSRRAAADRYTAGGRVRAVGGNRARTLPPA